jgi:hypothetical protein
VHVPNPSIVCSFPELVVFMLTTAWPRALPIQPKPDRNANAQIAAQEIEGAFTQY